MKNADKIYDSNCCSRGFGRLDFGRSGFSSIATLTSDADRASRLVSAASGLGKIAMRGAPYTTLRDGIRAHPTLVEVRFHCFFFRFNTGTDS